MAATFNFFLVVTDVSAVNHLPVKSIRLKRNEDQTKEEQEEILKLLGCSDAELHWWANEKTSTFFKSFDWREKSQTFSERKDIQTFFFKKKRKIIFH